MRLLLCNPNTDRSLTTRLAIATRASLGRDDALQSQTADGGASFIGSEEAIRIAKASLSETLAAQALDCDAILLGCFGDLGVDDLRRRFDRPIVSLSDACFAVAPLFAKRIAIVTTSAFWADRLAADVRRRNLSEQIVEICPTAAIAPLPNDELLSQCQAAIAQLANEDRCDAIILGGALLAADQEKLSASSPLPIIDVLAAAVGVCRALADIVGVNPVKAT